MMLSALLAAAALCQCAAVRPQRAGTGVAAEIAQIGALLEQERAKGNGTRKVSESLAAIEAASGIVGRIMASSANATQHMDDGDKALLQQVVVLLQETIYASMTSSHQADENSLATAIAEIEQCNEDIAKRQGLTGDLGTMHHDVQSKQNELNQLQEVVDEKTRANNSAWKALENHMQLIGTPPKVPDFPKRTMQSLNVYFERSDFCLWFSAQQAEYVEKRDKYVAADKALQEALAAYSVGKAKRDVQYCDWKGELESACTAFDDCYLSKTDFYEAELVPRVKSDMSSRIEAYKAGETLIQQIKFLLAKSNTRETPAVDTSRYDIDFQTVPGKGTCDLSLLTSSEWVPAVDCSKHHCNEELVGTLQDGYRGCQTRTKTGKTCQNWTEQTPHKHSRTETKYPNKGLGDHNKCRNPDHEPKGIWCYTTDRTSRWEYCDPL